MSLNKFLDNKEVKEKFLNEFPKPKFSIKREPLAQPLSPLYFMVGTAFHYLIGFYVEYLNPKAIAPKRWIAEEILSALNELEVIKSGVKLKSWSGITPPDLQLYPVLNKARNIILEAKENHLIFLQNGKITDNIIRSALLLAPLDEYYRRGVVDENIGPNLW